MLNKNTVDELCMFLPLIEKDLNKEVFEYFKYKWGMVDAQWHSHKNALKATGIQLKDKPEVLEAMVEKLIIARHNKMFSCRSCNADYRKVGIKIEKTGKQSSLGFINQVGNISRTTQDAFQMHRFKDAPDIAYYCNGCRHMLDDDDEAMFIIENGISKKSMLKFNEKFCGGKKVTARRMTPTINDIGYTYSYTGPSNFIFEPDIDQTYEV